MYRTSIAPLLAALTLCLSCDAEAPVCEGGAAVCSGTCTPVLTDPANCGGCGVACDEGLVCSEGACVAECPANPGAETCNGVDDDCNGAIDDLPGLVCYEGSASTIEPVTGLPMGDCRTGVQTCAAGSWGACTGQILPTTEACGSDGLGNGVDEDCDGTVDDGCGCTDGAAQPCYDGPAGTSGVGECRSGIQTCGGGSWSSCGGMVLPVQELCGNGLDDDCDGAIDDPATCDLCPEPPLICYEGPQGSLDPSTNLPRGACKAGTRACADGVLGACAGQVLPSPESCDGQDDDCNGIVDDGPPACAVGHTCVNGVCVTSG